MFADEYTAYPINIVGTGMFDGIRKKAAPHNRALGQFSDESGFYGEYQLMVTSCCV
jgi:hypothetical protein